VRKRESAARHQNCGSLLVMAIVGGAAMTPLMGFISEKFHSIAWAYTVPLFS
jgi:FHS family L-fucose permease-like MFS transporter